MGAGLSAAIVAAIVLYFLRKPGPDAADMLHEQFNAGVQNNAQQIEALRTSITSSMQDLNSRVSTMLAESGRNVGERLDNTNRVIGDVRETLGKLDQSSSRIIELGQDISSLQEILRPPKLRGSLGELFLSDLLAQVLPANHYKIQHRFKGGETVDAVVVLRSGLVPIDAKFPLDNFRKTVETESEDEKKAARKAFLKDVKGHIDSIASKYIRTDEQTFDFALMYVPAENVYYETIIKDDEFGGDMSLFNYALKKRVIPVSPNSFYAYLQTVILGLKGMRVEEHSKDILQNLGRLQKEFDNFSDAFRLVGRHLENSSKQYGEAERRFGRIESKVEQLDGLAKGLEGNSGADSEKKLLQQDMPSS